MFLSILLIIFILLFFSLLNFYSYPHPKFPRGHIGLPFIGFLLHFVYGKHYIHKLLKLKNKYGSVCSVQMGSFKCVMLNDAEVIREAWANPVFSGRPMIPGILDRTRGYRGGIIFNDGNDFVEQQKFLLKSLKECGFGSQENMENLILKEALELTQKLRKAGGQSISTSHQFNVAVLNSLWTITTGSRYAQDDPELVNLTRILDRNMELNDGVKIALFMPWIAKYFPCLIGWKKYLRESQDISDFWKKVAQERVNQFNGQSCGSNFVDTYIQHVKETQDPNSSFFGDKGVQSLAVVLQDLFIAGTETMAVTLTWAMLYLATFPHIQEALIAEIDSVLPRSGQQQRVLPKLTDKGRMPLLSAFILETMRFGTLAPLGMMHRTMEDVHFRQYFIPKDTIVFSNVSGVHMDKELWNDPATFRPTRFLSPDGKTLQSFKHFLAFSCGKRKCLGEILAKQQLYLFVTIILQDFQVKLDPSSPKPSLKPRVGVSAVPQPHKLIFKPRE